jgi:hypothetical protein
MVVVIVILVDRGIEVPHDPRSEGLKGGVSEPGRTLCQ